MAKKLTFEGKNASRIEIDLHNPDKKKELANIAYWKGYGAMADLVRTLLFRYIEESPDNLKRPRPKKDEDIG